MQQVYIDTTFLCTNYPNLGKLSAPVHSPAPEAPFPRAAGLFGSVIYRACMSILNTHSDKAEGGHSNACDNKQQQSIRSMCRIFDFCDDAATTCLPPNLRLYDTFSSTFFRESCPLCYYYCTPSPTLIFCTMANVFVLS